MLENIVCLQVNISMLARYILQIVGSLAVMFVVSPKLTAVLLAVVPLVAICASRYGWYSISVELGKTPLTYYIGRDSMKRLILPLLMVDSRGV